MAALLGARLLVLVADVCSKRPAPLPILDVDAGGTVLDEHLRQLHGGSDATMAGVGIGDDGVPRAVVSLHALE